MKLTVKLLGSLQRVFLKSCPENGISSLEGLRNEPLSFQVGYRSDVSSCVFYTKVESDLPVTCYRIGYVPVNRIIPQFCDEPLEVGAFPDMLLPYDIHQNLKNYAMKYSQNNYIGHQHQCHASSDCWQALWFTVNEQEQELQAGDYTVRVCFYDVNNNAEIGHCELSVHLVDMLMPKQSLLYTNWFHCDCIADMYETPVYSERFFELFEKYAKAAADYGMNMILLPAFTPPLDTAIGDTRMNVQLVGIEQHGDCYTFDFSLMKRFIKIAKKVGFVAFEHSHLFSQWGATSAPAVYAYVDGEYRQIFGWDTPSTSPAYISFLKQYFAALKQFLKEEPSLVYFHISDEPSKDHVEAYRIASEIVKDALGTDVKIFDAMSEPIFYEKGLLTTPVVVTTSVEKFNGCHCDDLWAYYTGGQSTEGQSNRTLYISPARNRSLGYMLYKRNINGFLHWAFNFWYDRPSVGLFDPKTEPCGYSGTAGTSFMVYPGMNEPILSMRLKVFYEGFCDMRALQAAEKVIGRAACEGLLTKYFGTADFYSAKPDLRLYDFRAELHRLLERR